MVLKITYPDKISKIIREDGRYTLLLHFAESSHKVTCRTAPGFSIRAFNICSDVLEWIVLEQFYIRL